MFPIPDPSGQLVTNAAAQLANTAWLVVPDSLSTALRIPQDCAEYGVNPSSIRGQPASPGDIIVVFATGFGKATPGGDPALPPLPTGEVAPPDGNPLLLTPAQPRSLSAASRQKFFSPASHPVSPGSIN